MPARTSLTGAWSGAYSYPNNAGPETVFNVRIEEVGGAFTGALQEPNLLHPDFGPVTTADIEGVRSGSAVSFTKFYNGSGGMSHAVGYEGLADSALMRIDGKWTVPGEWSGTFFMTRDDDGAEAEVKAAVEEQIVGRT